MTDSTDNALKPCPFCGSHGIDRDTYWHRDYCTNCGGKGPAAGNSPKANWNTRADLAPDMLADPRVWELVEAVEDGIKAGLLPKTSASEGGAAKYSAQVRAADRLRTALAALSTGGNDVPQVQKPADSASASDASGVTGGNDE